MHNLGLKKKAEVAFWRPWTKGLSTEERGQQPGALARPKTAQLWGTQH